MNELDRIEKIFEMNILFEKRLRWYCSCLYERICFYFHEGYEFPFMINDSIFDTPISLYSEMCCCKDEEIILNTEQYNTIVGKVQPLFKKLKIIYQKPYFIVSEDKPVKKTPPNIENIKPSNEINTPKIIIQEEYIIV